MAKQTTHRRSRRAFLSGAGSLAATLAAASHGESAPLRARSTSQPRDRGLWVTWYDLPDAGRTDYLAWAHQTYIPALLKRSGYLWAAHYASIPDSYSGKVKRTDDHSVPTGSAYILVVGAEDTNVFGNPVPDELHASLPEASRKMLSMRTGERTNIFAEASRVTGPGNKDYKDGMALAPCIQFGTYNIDPKKELDLVAWYTQLQMPEMGVAPGCVRTRRLASVSGWAKLGILYEFTSVDLRGKAFGGGRGGGTPHKWQGSLKELVHAPGSPNVARRIWPVAEG